MSLNIVQRKCRSLVIAMSQVLAHIWAGEVVLSWSPGPGSGSEEAAAAWLWAQHWPGSFLVKDSEKPAEKINERKQNQSSLGLWLGPVHSESLE